MTEVLFLETIGVMVIAAAIAIVTLRRTGLPSIVLCIAAGLVIGPIFGFITSEPTEVAMAAGGGEAALVDEVAEASVPADADVSAEVRAVRAIDDIGHLGIVLLLFLVGLELSFDRIRDLGKVTLVAGVGQILLTFVLGSVVALAIAPLASLSTPEVLIVAGAVTLSSTVVVVRMLEQRNELSSLHGRIAVGILLLQDLAAIVGMTVLHGLGSGDQDIGHALEQMPLAFLAMAVMAGLALLASKYLLPRPFAWFARHGQTLIVSGLAWCLVLVGLASSMGLSAEIGAFLAGVSLAQLSCAHDLVRRLHPLMTFFITVFFVALGAAMDLEAAASVWPAALVLIAFVLLVKPAIIAWLVARCRYGERTAFASGVSLGQISEFSFIIAAMALSSGLVDEAVVGLIALAGVGSIVASAAVFSQETAVRGAFVRLGLLRWLRATPEPPAAPPVVSHGHVVVAGMNDMGTRVVRQLVEGGFDVVAIDSDPAKLRGLPCRTLQGSLDDLSLLEHAGLSHAVVGISALQIEEVNNLFAWRCRNFGVPCVIHAFDGSLVDELRRQGVEHLVDSKLHGNVRLVTTLAEHGIITP